jgi:phage FluMu protein Com
MEHSKFLHPANVEEVASIAKETGAEVLRGLLRYPSETGGWQLGDVDLSEHLAQYRDCEIVLVIATTGQAEEERDVCGICGFVLDEVSECPRCKLINEELARRIKARQETRETMFGEVGGILGGEGE